MKKVIKYQNQFFLVSYLSLENQYVSGRREYVWLQGRRDIRNIHMNTQEYKQLDCMPSLYPEFCLMLVSFVIEALLVTTPGFLQSVIIMVFPALRKV